MRKNELVLSLHKIGWTDQSIANHLGWQLSSVEAITEAADVYPLPPHPTDHPAGSMQRVEVLAWRKANGYQLWHPLDRVDCSGMRGDFVRRGTGSPGKARSKVLRG